MLTNEVNIHGEQLLEPDATLILPAYMEASRDDKARGMDTGDPLRKAYEKYFNVFDREFGSNFEIVIVNDGSTDDTLKLARDELGATTISYPVNQGRGFALQQAFTLLNGKAIGYTDADGSYSEDLVLRLFNAVLSGEYDIATTHRPKEAHSSRLRRLGHFGIHGICERFSPTNVKDPQAGLKVMSNNVAHWLWSPDKMPIPYKWTADRHILSLAKILELKTLDVEAGDVVTFDNSTVKIGKDTLDMLRHSMHSGWINRHLRANPDIARLDFSATPDQFTFSA